MLASVIGLYVVSASPAGRRHLRLGGAAHDRPADPRSRPRSGSSSASSSPSRSRRRWCRSTPGCPTPVPRRRSARVCCWSACSTRSAPSASCATACRCSRWPRAARAAGAGAGGGRHPLRGAARGRAERHEAARRLHLDRPLRLHRARHLRLHHPGVRRRGALHGQPRPRHRPAVPDGRHARLARRVAHDQRLRRRGQARAAARRRASCWPACRRWRCRARTRSSASSWC